VEEARQALRAFGKYRVGLARRSIEIFAFFEEGFGRSYGFSRGLLLPRI
jgi:hypothetical protein